MKCPHCKGEIPLTTVGLAGFYKVCLNCYRVFKEYPTGTLKEQKRKQ